MAAPWRTLSIANTFLQNSPVCRRCYSILPPVWISGRSRAKTKGKPPGIALSWDEKMDARASEDIDANLQPVNIGVLAKQMPQATKFRKMQAISRQTRTNKALEEASRLSKLELPLEDIKTKWWTEEGVFQSKAVAEHYGIYKDLFGHAYFYPVVNLSIAYDLDEDHVLPVYRGNHVEPNQAREEPYIEYEADEDSLWTLIMTNPDGHLTENSAEYLHWFIGNIPGNEISKGEMVCDYLQPFPPKGTGFHRHAFILFKQERKLDYAEHRRPENCTSLKERTFSTYDFYERHQDDLTPMGLCFFQSQYDDSVRDIYHKVLDMREPSFEYKHPVPYHPPQERYPRNEPFDRFYDRYRDKKDLAEEVLKMKLKKIDPLEPPPPPEEYPLVQRLPRRIPSWLKKREELIARRVEQFKDL